MSRKSTVVSIASREANLKRKLRRHLTSIGFEKDGYGNLTIKHNSKEAIRQLHSKQREERLLANESFVKRKGYPLLKYFASGSDVDPEKITPVLERVYSDTFQSDLFRLASLTWSVPVSRGFGRRIRYLVWDDYNGKLLGIIAIGDPVFNLRVRDSTIGWDINDRRDRLVNIMDAYVLGAIPPYNSLLGGKLVACLLRSKEIYDDFLESYGDAKGIISKENKSARLLAITTSSSMGKSSVYNRLKLDGIRYLRPIGFTGGWGHFHIPDDLFQELREYLNEIGHPYARQYEYGEGPNWRLRATKAALSSLGFKENMLKHGIQREVFMCSLAQNAEQILKTGNGEPDLSTLLPCDDIARLALDRWVIPRSIRRPEYKDWRSDRIVELLGSQGRSIKKVQEDKVISR